MKRSDSIKELAGALSKAQVEFTSAERDHTAKVAMRSGGSYSFNYADLAAYLEVCRKPLGDNGLSFLQEPEVNGNVVSVTTLLMHASGEWIESNPFKLTVVGQGDGTMITPQVVGSGITYARRYSLSSLIGMASETDDDGNKASGNLAQTEPREPREPRQALPACPKCGKTESVIVGKAEYGGGLVCFDKKGGCKHKWQPGAEEEKPKKGTVVDPPNEDILAEWRKLLAGVIGNEDGRKKLNELMADARALEDIPTRMAVWKLINIKAVEYNCRFDDTKKTFVPN